MAEENQSIFQRMVQRVTGLFNPQALLEATIEQGLESEIAREKSMGFSRESIGCRLLEIQERVEGRVAQAEINGEELGSGIIWSRQTNAKSCAI